MSPSVSPLKSGWGGEKEGSGVEYRSENELRKL